MKKSAFTLIEVMVVLSVLAIIAMLGYNFFGSTMKEASTLQASTELIKHLNGYVGAYEEYERKNGVALDTSDPPTQAALKESLVADGILRSIMTPSPKWEKTVGCTSIYSPTGIGYIIHRAFGDIGGPTTAHDEVVSQYCVTDDICTKFNEQFSPTGNAPTVDTWVNIYAKVQSGAIQFPACMRPTDKAWGNIAMQLVRMH